MRKVFFILAVLRDEDVDWLARAGRVVHAPAEEVIIRQGEASRDLFFVLEGYVDVLVEGVGAIARLASGEVVGEMSFVDNTPPSATVRTGAAAKLLAVDKRDLAERMQADPPFAARFYRALAMFLSDRLRAANRGAADDDSDLLDENLLGEVANAGQRFDMMLKQLLGAKR
jgi:CRP/FNR family cyclic AMP-dependent transcriptional regulator